MAVSRRWTESPLRTVHARKSVAGYQGRNSRVVLQRGVKGRLSSGLLITGPIGTPRSSTQATR